MLKQILAQFRFIRRIVTKTVRRTERVMIPSVSTNCQDDPFYEADTVMVDLITEKVGCIVPWSNNKHNTKVCKTKADFQRYLEENKKLQQDLLSMEKCNHSVWTISHYDDMLIESNDSIVDLQFIASTKKVIVEKETYIYSTEYFISTLGGYLGLFLGGSILGFIELIEKTILSKIE